MNVRVIAIGAADVLIGIHTHQSEKLNLKVECPFSQKVQKSFIYMGRAPWNDLAAEEQWYCINDVDLFTTKIKRKQLELEQAMFGVTH